MARGKDKEAFGAARSALRSATSPIVLVDACVWHHSFSRNVLRHLALTRAIRIRWSRAIEAEWISSVLRARPDIARSTLIAVRDRFRVEFPDGLVPEVLPRHRIPPLPDPDDQHVLRAALVAGASVICTVDQHGFPARLLGPMGIEARPPSAVLSDCALQRDRLTCAALQTHRSSLRRPAYTPDEYLAALDRAELIQDATTRDLLLHGLRRPVP